MTWSLPLPPATGETSKQVTTTRETEEGMRIEWLMHLNWDLKDS